MSCGCEAKTHSEGQRRVLSIALVLNATMLVCVWLDGKCTAVGLWEVGALRGLLFNHLPINFTARLQTGTVNFYIAGRVFDSVRRGSHCFCEKLR
jgi:hypothetical protein